MKNLGIIILLSFFLGACNGQTNSNDQSSYVKTIKSQAEIMKNLLLKKDFKAFTKFTYPKVIEMMGGKEKMVEILEKGIQKSESDGTELINITIGEPSAIITMENELQCTLQETLELRVPNGKLITKSTLIAISTDNGKNWYFIDTSGKDIQKMKSILPNLSEELNIPEPTFYKK